MKRIIALLLLVAMATGCAAEEKDAAGRLDRDALLPDDYAAGIAGAPVRRALDEKDAAQGIARWAWEEAEGEPRLLAVEIRFPPADCDALYNRAQAGEGTCGIVTPQEATGCYDGRAAHIRFGEYYIRIAALGIGDEKGKAELIAAKLVRALIPKK